MPRTASLPNLTPSGRAHVSWSCQLLEVDRTTPKPLRLSLRDPKPTSVYGGGVAFSFVENWPLARGFTLAADSLPAALPLGLLDGFTEVRGRIDGSVAFGGTDCFLKEADALTAYVRGCPPADPAKPITLPGDPERAAKAARRQSGIAVPDGTWALIARTAAELGVP